MLKRYVSLRVMSETVVPEQITELLHLEPDSVWLKGDVRRGTALVERENGWEVKVSCGEAAELDEHLSKLLERVTSAAAQIKELSSSCVVQVSCVVYADSPPPLNFSASLISTLAAMGACLDIDLYLDAIDPVAEKSAV